MFLTAVDPTAAAAIAERIRARIANAGDGLTLTASIGIAHHPQHAAASRSYSPPPTLRCTRPNAERQTACHLTEFG